MQCLARRPPEGGSHTGSSGRGGPFRRWLARRLPPRSSRDERGLSSLRSGATRDAVLALPPVLDGAPVLPTHSQEYPPVWNHPRIDRTCRSLRACADAYVERRSPNFGRFPFSHDPRRSPTRDRGPTGRAARDPHRQALSGENPNAAAAGVARGHERARALNNQLVAGKTPALPAVVLAHEHPVG